MPRKPRPPRTPSVVTVPAPVVAGSTAIGAPVKITNWNSVTSYQWQRGGGTTWGTISGATGATYVTTSADLAQSIRVVATLAGVSANSAPLGPISAGGGSLLWAPPGWDGVGDPGVSSSYPGYTVVTPAGGNQTLNLSNSVDYFVDLSTVAWNATATPAGNRTTFGINGGRNVVIVGGSITVNKVNNTDDAVGLFIDGGAVGGIVHVEGVSIDAQNCITMRTPRMLQLQNCRLTAHAYLDDHSNVHPDCIQVWQQGTSSTYASFTRCAGIRINRCTLGSTMTYFTDLTDGSLVTDFGVQTVASWEMHDVDVHALAPLSGTPPLIGLNIWMGAPLVATCTGTNLWWETSWESGSSRRDLGDVLRQYGLQYTPAAASFEIWRGGSTIYTSPSNPSNGAGSGLSPAGGVQGDQIRFDRMNLISWIWNTQVAPTSVGADANGNFCAASVPGPSYVSPRYL